MSPKFRLVLFLMFSNQTCICHLFRFSGRDFLHFHTECSGHQPRDDKMHFRSIDVGDKSRQHSRTRKMKLHDCETVPAAFLMTFYKRKMNRIKCFSPFGAKHQLRSEDENIIRFLQSDNLIVCASSWRTMGTERTNWKD